MQELLPGTPAKRIATGIAAGRSSTTQRIPFPDRRPTMSYLNANWLRPAVGLLVVIAVAALWLTGTGSTEAGNPGSVSISPASANVGAGGTTTVDVNVTAPDGGLSVWIVQIGYDPNVVQVDTSGGNPVCTANEIPGTTFQGYGCAAKDSPPTGSANDTAVAFGAWVANSGGNPVGWTGTQTVASFTFRAVGTAGQSSPLTVSVAADSFLGPDGAVATPTTNNGLITITSGTSRIWGDSDCSGAVAPRDGQGVLKKFLNQTPPDAIGAGCPGLGDSVNVGGTPRIWGDWDCNAAVAPRDGQSVLKKFLNQTPPDPIGSGCPGLGDSVTVS